MKTYITVKYYFSDKSIAYPKNSPFLKKKEDIVCWGNIKNSTLSGSLVLTEDSNFFFNQKEGSSGSINSEFLRDDDDVLWEWMNIKQVKHILDIQPYDIEDVWSRSGMYSKSLWKQVLKDIRDYKIELLTGKFEVNKIMETDGIVF